MESHANGKQPLAAELPQPPPPSSPPKPRVSFSPEVAAVNGGGRVDSGGSCSPKASPRQATGEGGRSRAEASRPQAGLGIGDFAVMGKLGEGGYGTVGQRADTSQPPPPCYRGRGWARVRARAIAIGMGRG